MHLLKAVACVALLSCSSAFAQRYPTKPITLVVPFPPGGTTDALARLMASELTRELGKPVVVENKGGAGGTIGSALVAKAPADGYTLLFGNQGPNAISPSIYKDLPYDAAHAFKPLSLVANFPLFVVTHPSVPAHNIQELLAYARTLPKGLDYASTGVGSTSHVAGLLLAKLTGAPLVHIPYKGGGPAITDLIGGQVPLMFLGIYDDNIKTGRLRAIATSSSKRAVAAPDLPTVIESGVPGFDVTAWFGLLTTAGTPEPIVQRLHQAIATAVSRPSVQKQIEGFGGEPVTNTPDQFSQLIASDIVRWQAILKETQAIQSQ